jgi:SAM-dependent methyltransferase
VRAAAAESLPFADGEFDAVLAQLVVSMMSDADAGVREMRRVARPGGAVGACVWDFGGGMTVLRAFWDAAAALDPDAARLDQAKTRPFSTRDELRDLWSRAGLGDVRTGELRAGAAYSDFDDLWRPLVAPDGAPGRFYGSLRPVEQEELREDVWRRLGSPTDSFRLTARAWYAVGDA